MFALAANYPAVEIKRSLILTKNMWQQWVNFVLGIWVIAVPFLGMTANALMWTMVVSGIVIAAVALWGTAETKSEREEARMVHRVQH